MSGGTGGGVNLNESQQSGLRTLFITMLILPTVVVIIRTWARFLLPVSPTSQITSRFWWDDWTVFAAAALNVIVLGMGLKLVDLGLGLHVQAVPPQNLVPFLKLLWIIYFFFDTGTAVSKSSALFFYARIFGVTGSRFKYALWAVHAMNVAWLIAILLAVTFMCNPIEKAWITSLPGQCSNTGILWLGSGAASLAIDVIILLMPLPMLWRLRMTTVRKLQVTGVFVCGYLVVVVSIGRLITILQAGDEVEQDPTYKVAIPVLWLGSEIAISIISVSLPSIFFLAQRVRRQGFRSLLSSHHHSESKLGINQPRSNGEDGRELVSQSSKSFDSSAGDPSRTVLFPTRIQTTAQFGGGRDSIENPGIHVRRDVMVV